MLISKKGGDPLSTSSTFGIIKTMRKRLLWLVPPSLFLCPPPPLKFRLTRWASESEDEAWRDHDLLKTLDSALISSSESLAETVNKEGVALVDCVLEETERLRDFILENEAFETSAVLGELDDDEKVARFDLRLPYEPIVKESLENILKGPLGRAFADLATEEAELYELAALVSLPGSPPQPLHSDTLWDDQASLFTAFVALQDIPNITYGPTRFLLRTHHDSDFSDLLDDASSWTERRTLLKRADPKVALLKKGEAALYDGRLLHCGTPNTSLDMKRVLFYVTFRHPEGDIDLGNDEAHSICSMLQAKGLRLKDFLL